ncbi:MAG TPA: hypothetical protein DEP28_12270 [Bacteroidetes bacterium]|nr:hypothetical protein [Bacteroidota bacterium]HCN36616.1 hypothetical protein [Bacteroidota bacterium]
MEFNNDINYYELDRSKPPKSKLSKDVSFPGYFETVTSNGIEVIVIEDNSLPVVSVRFVYKSGSYSDNNLPGLSSFTTDMLSKGTDEMSATEIAEKIDFYGASLSYGTDSDANFISAYTLEKYFDEVFKIISSVLTTPSFKDEEIERLRIQKVNSIKSLKDESDYLALRAFKTKVFGASPYALPIEGFESTVNKINRENLVSFYKDNFIPSKLLVAFVGKISPDKAIKYIEESFGHLNNPDSEIEGNFINPVISDKPVVLLSDKNNAVQSTLKIGHLSVSRSEVDFFPAYIMNNILGGSFTSRINYNLREINGFTYGARSYFEFNKFAGDFSVETEVKTGITANAITEILKELKKIRDEKVTDEELTAMKNYITGNFPLQLETPNSIASKVINLKLYNLDKDFYSKYISNINKVTKDEVLESAKKYLHPDRLCFSVCGDVKILENDLKHFGEIEVVTI